MIEIVLDTRFCAWNCAHRSNVFQGNNQLELATGEVDAKDAGVAGREVIFKGIIKSGVSVARSYVLDTAKILLTPWPKPGFRPPVDLRNFAWVENPS